MYGDIMNLIIGLTSGIVVSLLLSIAKYLSAKRKLMTDLYCEFITIHNLFVEYANAGNNIAKKEACIKKIDMYNKSRFNFLIGDICFFFRSKKHFSSIYEKIYKKINEWFSKTSELNHMISHGLKLDGDFGKQQIDKLNNVLLDENGKTRIKILFETDINTWFYELAFGKTYEEAIKNAD